MVRGYNKTDICSSLDPSTNSTITNIDVSYNAWLPCIACETIVKLIKSDPGIVEAPPMEMKDKIEHLCEILAPLKDQHEIVSSVIFSLN